MKNKAMLLNAKMRMKKQSMQIILEDEALLEERASELMLRVDSAETEEILSEVEQELKDLQTELDQKKQEKEQLEQEISELETEIKELTEKTPKNEEERKGEVKMEVREKFGSFIRSKGTAQEGLKLVDGGALIPVEHLEPQETKTVQVDLTKLVNVVKVSTGSGEYPIITKSGKKLVSVEELEKNPELAKPKITKQQFSVKTYRGHLAISQETIDDAEYDIVGLVERDAKEQELNTKNEEIAKVFKAATPVEANGLDGIKDILNTKITSSYVPVLVVTDSMYNALDKVKDKEGRYVLQPDVTSPTGYSFSGRVIYRLPDEILGEAEGEMKGFIGDPFAFCTLFDRQQTTAKWVANDIYGQLLGIYARFDTRATDTKAGVYVTFTPSA